MRATHKCPECGSNTLRVQVPQTATVRFQDDSEHEVINVDGDLEWDDDCDAWCTGCGLTGTLKDFNTENTIEEAP